jgi:hypothetical protein
MGLWLGYAPRKTNPAVECKQALMGTPPGTL